MERIVLAYSGGLDTSVAIPWLPATFGAEVIAVTLDLGQGRDLADTRARALALGAIRAHVLDVRDEFAREYVLPALQAGALHEDRYPLATALARPLIAKKLVAIARMEGATAIAHGSSGNGGHVRLEISTRALAPDLRVIAPARLWGMSHRDELEYARAHHVSVSADSPYRTDSNLWGRSIEGGMLDDPWKEPPDDIYTLTRAPRDCPDEPAYVEIEFEAGVPVRANGIDMALPELIESLETIAGAHGVGRLDAVENRITGIKSREVYEAPAAVVLHAAHKELESLAMPRELARLKRDLARVYADLVYDGLWFSPTRDALNGFVAAIQPRVTGAIRLKLFKGECRVCGRRSPFALHDTALVTTHTSDAVDRTAGSIAGRPRTIPAGSASR